MAINTIEVQHNISSKNGYKQTKLGWIPEDWGIESLETLQIKRLNGVLLEVLLDLI